MLNVVTEWLRADLSTEYLERGTFYVLNSLIPTFFRFFSSHTQLFLLHNNCFFFQVERKCTFLNDN